LRFSIEPEVRANRVWKNLIVKPYAETTWLKVSNVRFGALSINLKRFQGLCCFHAYPGFCEII
jgi:hypothetical protein